MESNGIVFNIKYCTNSAAIFDYSEFHLDMVRKGITFYNLATSSNVRNLPLLKPVISIYSIITRMKTLSAGQSIYSAGINGLRAKTFGNICMDRTMVDVIDINCDVGDEVVIFRNDLPFTVTK